MDRWMNTLDSSHRPECEFAVMAGRATQKMTLHSLSGSFHEPGPAEARWLSLSNARWTILSHEFEMSPVVRHKLATAGTPIGPWIE